MTDEEYVRATWERAELCPCPYNNRFNTSLGGRGFTLSNPGEEDIPAEAWAVAAEFTRERMEQIREIEEERAMLCGKVLLEDRDMAIMKRILAARESALADLKRGMKA